MSLFRDLRYAIRLLWKDRGFSLVVIVLLALGIAATPAIFSFADALFWKPLSAPHPEQLVRIFVRSAKGIVGGGFSYPEFVTLRDRTTSFNAMAAEYPTAPLNVVADNDSREHNGAVVTANYFSVLGLTAARGRFFRDDEDAVPDRDPVAVISARLWRSRFAAEPSTLGREISINGIAFRVIGIAPENFYGDEPGVATDVWIPTAMVRVGYRWCDAYADINCGPLHLLTRLKRGRGRVAAESEVNAVATAAHLPASTEGQHVVVLPAVGVRPDRQSDLAPQVRLLMAIALMLLLIACSNVAGLLIARGVARRREIAVRLAIGARRSRVVRQLLTESFVLALLGAALGLLLAAWIRNGFVSFYTMQSEGGRAYYDLTPDWRVWLVCAGCAVLTGLLFGVVPAIRAVRTDMTGELKSGAGSIGLQHSASLRDLLAAAQVALSLVLLVAAGLMLHSAEKILGGANFDPHHVVIMRLRPRLVKYTPAQAESLYREVAHQLPDVPGVESVTLGMGGSGLLWTPQTGKAMRLSVSGEQDRSVRVLPVTGSFFSTLRIPVLQGHVFEDRDQPGAPMVILVNQAAAQQFWPHASAIGQVLVLNKEAYRVIGVVGDIALHSVNEKPAPQFYSAFWQSNPGAQGDLRMAVRVKGDSGAALSALRRAIFVIDPRVPIGEDMPLPLQVKSVYAEVWLARSVTVWCGVFALVLSAVGLYSVLAFTVRCRTREIGVRMALGARPTDVVTLVVRRGLLVCIAGCAVGLVMASAASRLLGSFLYGVRAFDLIAFSAGPLALIVVALAASYLPARRAAQVDPMIVLRCD